MKTRYAYSKSTGAPLSTSGSRMWDVRKERDRKRSKALFLLPSFKSHLSPSLALNGLRRFLLPFSFDRRSLSLPPSPPKARNYRVLETMCCLRCCCFSPTLLPTYFHSLLPFLLPFPNFPARIFPKGVEEREGGFTEKR